MKNPLPLVALALLVASGCAHNPPKTAEKPKAGKGPAADFTAQLIASADAQLQSGLAEARAGHMNAARTEFDRAVDLYLTAPGGAYANPRLSEAYRRTLETIHVHEMEALAAGDGFSGQPAEPASIDDLAGLDLEQGHATEETRRVAEEIVKDVPADVPLVLNDEVLGCIDLYQGTLRDWFTEALERGGRYLPHIREVFKQEGIPQDLAYVALVESAFKPSALSRAQARGVWQFIPETGRRFGLQQDWWVDERSDPEKSTRAAAAYLKQLYEMFGKWDLALASYNAGEGRIMRATSRLNTDDFWELARRGALPRETENYVPMIQAAILVAKAPDKYGFEVTPEPALVLDTVTVKTATDLRLVAECAHSDVGELQQLNPALRRMATPARSFDLKVPSGTAATVTSCLDAIPAARRVAFRTHVVAKGQTLASIGRSYGVTPTAIAQANNIKSSTRLARGAELIIPVEPRGSRTAAPAPPPAARAASTARLGSGKSAAPARETVPMTTAAAGKTPAKIVYKVQSGDTLTSIAARFRTTVQKLSSWNGLRNSRLVAGNTLLIYTY